MACILQHVRFRCICIPSQKSDQLVGLLITADMELPCFMYSGPSLDFNSRKTYPVSCNINMNRRTAILVGLAAISVPLLKPYFAVDETSEQSDESQLQSKTKKKRLFATCMENNMVEYEKRIEGRKRQLFSELSSESTVVDIGIGTGPNIKYIPKGATVIGVEPNQFMWKYAKEKASARGVNLQLVDGTGEHIPLPDNSCDFVITTLTLCSVKDQNAVIHEILRVLKPGGVHLFVEHVIASPSRPILRFAQNILTPLQVREVDGCHLNRDTGKTLSSATHPGFSEVDYDEFDADFGSLNAINLLRPHIAGYARKEAP